MRCGNLDMGADMTPDAFLDDWYAWATNQLSHALIGLALTGVLAVILRAVAGQERRAVALAIVAAVYFVGWESAWQAFGAGLLDALADTAFVAIGGLIGVSAWAQRGAQLVVAMVAVAGILVAGIVRRWR